MLLQVDNDGYISYSVMVLTLITSIMIGCKTGLCLQVCSSCWILRLEFFFFFIKDSKICHFNFVKCRKERGDLSPMDRFHVFCTSLKAKQDVYFFVIWGCEVQKHGGFSFTWGPFERLGLLFNVLILKSLQRELKYCYWSANLLWI